MANKSLKPGENNIDNCTVVPMKNGGWKLQWKLCTYDGNIERHETKNKKKSLVKPLAKKRAEQLLASHVDWTPDDAICDFVAQVSIPSVENDKKLRPRSKKNYLRHLRYFSEEFKGVDIRTAVRPKRLQAAFNAVARKHGTDTAEQVRKVANGRIMKKLVFEEVIDHNPLDETTVEITVQERKAGRVEETKALTYDEYDRAYDYVLAADPNDPEYTVPKASPYTQEQRAARRATYLDITLLQMATGLRISEVLHLTRDDVTINGNKVTLEVMPETSKTHRGRRVRILKSDVAKRFQERLDALPAKANYIFHTPNNPCTRYDTNNADKAVNRFLQDEVAKVCNIEPLKHQGSHTWRMTLNTFAKEKKVPVEIRAAYFGHSEDVNEQYYTDAVDVSDFVSVMFD